LPDVGVTFIRGAGQRVMESVTHFLTHRLKLKVNQAKSAVARPRQRKFLGFSFTNEREPRRRIAPKAIVRFNGSKNEGDFANFANVGGKDLAAQTAAVPRALGGLPILPP
jgi:hypothetical protein